MMVSIRRCVHLIGGLAVVFLILASFAPAHKFYLGLSEVRVDTKKKTLDVSCKLFLDDLDDALGKKFGKKFDLKKVKMDQQESADLAIYMKENFKINVGGKLQELTLVGYETEDDAIWIYLETVPFTAKGRVAVMNSLLYDHLPEQVNMLNVYWNGVSKTAKLSNPEKLAEFDF